MQQLDVPTVRELEDFIIAECFYSNIVQGKLDQTQRCLHVGVGGDKKWQALGLGGGCQGGGGTKLGQEQRCLHVGV